MRLENSSKTLLAITKSKAKMYEFGIEESHHISLPVDPRNLLILTIGILGDLSALEAKSSSRTDGRYIELKDQLMAVGQYFDALNQSHVADGVSVYLKLLGASAYYLADMPGASSVLSKELPYDLDELTPSYLERLLVWILKSDFDASWYRYEGSVFFEDIDSFVASLREYFYQRASFEQFFSIASSLRKKVYEYGNDRELLLIDIIISLALRKIFNSSISLLPQYTNLPIEEWAFPLNKPGFIKELWPAQKLLGEEGVLSGESAVVQMPTSAGKTKSTELMIRSSFLSGRSELAVVVAPFRALCREITDSFEQAFYGEDVNINELQDVTQITEVEEDFIRLLLEGAESEMLPAKSIIVSTPEKLVYLLRHEPQLAAEIGLLIFDEGHQFDTGKRGVTYELLIASLKGSISENVQTVLISAVMTNAESIGDWLNGEQGVEIHGNQCLPTIRNVAFVSWQASLGQLHYLDQELEADREFFVPRVIEQINLGTRGRERTDRLFPTKSNNSSIAAYLGVKLCHQGPVAVFCGVKSTVTTISELLVDCYERNLQIPPPSNSSDQDELDKIGYLSSLHFGNDFILTKSIKLGVLPHSANIPNGVRVSVEWAMENNKGCLVICTSTLAQGVNLPIKYLIVSSTFQAGQEISTRDFHNLIGRAGRAGYHTEGSVIFADADIYDFRRDFRRGWKWRRALHLLDFDNAEDCLSSLKELIEPFYFDGIDVDVMYFISSPEACRQQCIGISNDEGIDIGSLISEMDYKLTLIETIESYFLSHLKENPDIDQSVFVSLAQGTLAFSLSDDNERALLSNAFDFISRKVMNLDRAKIAFYGKALLGIDQLLIIDEWIEGNGYQLELLESSEDILRFFWPTLVRLNKSNILNKIQSNNISVDFAIAWIAGASYSELMRLLIDGGAYYQANTQQRRIKMDHVIDLAESALSFDATLIVGALADLLEGKGYSEDVIGNVRFLQSRLKLGLATDLELRLYLKGFVDREVCKLLAGMLVNNGVPSEGFDYRLLDQHSGNIKEVLSELPGCFMQVID